MRNGTAKTIDLVRQVLVKTHPAEFAISSQPV